MKIKNYRVYHWQISLLILFLVFLIIYTFINIKTLQNQQPKIEVKQNNWISQDLLKAVTTENLADCVSEVRPVTVRGNSLAGLIEEGEDLKILVGYYRCHQVEREDIVAYNYAGSELPVVKIVKGISGDKFKLEKSKAGCGWNILINGGIVKNSQGKDYCLNEQGNKMLSLYERTYNGIIPDEAYLILGNLTEGSLDSSNFGLVGKNDFLGMAVKY